MEQLRGREHTDLEWYLGRRDLDEAVATTAPADQRLAQAVGADRDPDDVPGTAAYEKGSLFLRTLEHAVGRDKLDAFLRRWFDEHAFTSTTTAVFEQSAQVLAYPRLAQWLHEPGIPADAVPAQSKRADARIAEAAACARDGMYPDPPVAGWTTLDWVVFLRALPELSLGQLQLLDMRYVLSMSPNAEIQMYWFPILVRADAEGAQPMIARFLERVGRQRMIKPLYEAMVAKGGDWRTFAEQIYAHAKPRYHPLVRKTIEALFHKKE
jgi:leukotriene-A4 hydrolase